jgi:hypothetical protein
MSSLARDQWLSLTPEPERDLPAAIATLRAGEIPEREAIEAERRRAEQLVLRGSRRRWRAWLREAVELADARGQDGPALAAARELVLDVIYNHDALALGLPGDRRSRGHAERADDELLERIRAREEKGS